jgi:hypothetical protein
VGTGGGAIELSPTSGGTGLGTLELDGTSSGGFTVTKTVTTRGRQTATINEVSLRNIDGNNTVSTVSTTTGGAQFNYESAGGSLTINNWVTTGSGGQRTLRLLGAASGTMAGWSPVAGNVVTLIKDGTGTWTIGSGMNVADGAFGPTTVNAGNLILAPGVGARFTGSNSTTSVVPNITINNGGRLTVQAANGTDGEVGNAPTPGTITVNAGGMLDASSFTTYSLQANQTLIGAGTFRAGTLSVSGDNAIHLGASAASTAVGTLTVQGALSLSNAFSSATGGLYFNLGNATTPGAGVNDLISVQGPAVVDNSGGPINVRRHRSRAG